MPRHIAIVRHPVDRLGHNRAAAADDGAIRIFSSLARCLQSSMQRVIIRRSMSLSVASFIG
jgi:hypothetical protein